MPKKNLNHFPHSVRPNSGVADHDLLHETDKLLVRVHKIHGIQVFFFTIAVILIATPYLWSAYFKNHVRLGYTLSGQSISMQSKARVKYELENNLANFIMEIPSQNASEQSNILVKSSDLNAVYDTEVTIAGLFAKPDEVAPVAMLDDLRRVVKPVEIKREYRYDAEKFEYASKLLLTSLNWDAKDAYVAFVDGKFQAYDQVSGSKISENAIKSGLAEALRYGYTTFEPISEKIPADVDMDAATLAAANAQKIVDQNLSVSVYGRRATTTLAERSLWISFKKSDDGSLTAYLDKNLITLWANKLNGKYTSKNKTIDVEEAVKVVIKALTDKDPEAIASIPTLAKGYARATSRSWRKFVEVDLTRQRMYAWENGRIRLISGTVTGAPATPTRPGVFKVYQKQIGKYFATADGFRGRSQYWMRFDDGRGLHDANWRTKAMFGKPAIRRCCGSHGCVNLPIPVAKWLYSWTKVGTVVWVHH